MYNNNVFVKKQKSIKWTEAIVDNDLFSLTRFFLEHWRNDSAIFIDSIYYFLTMCNGDRSFDKAGKMKISDIQVLIH